MRKPLGYRSYLKGNKWQTLRYMLCLSICIIILVETKLIITSQQKEIRYALTPYHFMTRLESKHNRLIPKEVLKEIEGLEEVEAIYPLSYTITNCNVLFYSIDQYTFFLDKAGIKTLLGRMDPSYKLGGMPVQDGQGVIMASKMLMNQGLSLLDTVPGYNGLYVAGQYEFEGALNFCPTTLDEESVSYLVIPKEGKLEALNEGIRKVVSGEISIIDRAFIQEENQLAYGGVEDNFNIIMMIVTLVTSITAGTLTYLHYYSRRKEMGILSAIGYSNKWMIKRITKEIFVSTGITTAIAMIGIMLLNDLFNRFINEPNGFVRFELDGSVLSVMLMIPLFMMVFSLVPTWILLCTVQKMTLVQRGY